MIENFAKQSAFISANKVLLLRIFNITARPMQCRIKHVGGGGGGGGQRGAFAICLDANLEIIDLNKAFFL